MKNTWILFLMISWILPSCGRSGIEGAGPSSGPETPRILKDGETQTDEFAKVRFEVFTYKYRAPHMGGTPLAYSLVNVYDPFFNHTELRTGKDGKAEVIFTARPEAAGDYWFSARYEENGVWIYASYLNRSHSDGSAQVIPVDLPMLPF